MGITAVRALAGHLPVDVVHRASAPADVALVEELRAVERHPGVRVHLLAGPRDHHPLDPAHLGALLGPLRGARVYVCGPRPFHDRIARSAHARGVTPDRVHHEQFDL